MSTTRLLPLLTAIGLLVAGASPATAATRFAAPEGSGSECTRADPCRIHDAVELAEAGDEVVLLGGTYALGTDTLDITRPTNVHGERGGPRARLVYDASGVKADAVLISGAEARLADATIVNPGRGTALAVEAADVRVERVVARGAQDFDAFACELTGTGIAVTNSVCHVPGGREGLAVYIRGLPGAAAEVVLRNVTAILDGPPSSDGAAIFAETPTNGFPLRVDGFNVIARDNGPNDVGASSDSAKAGVRVNLSNSNFGTEFESGDATVTDPGSETNQTAMPAFVDAVAGNFRQAPGSPTIDAGASGAALGAFDFEGDARIQGARVDIGADEIGADSAPPEPIDADGPEVGPTDDDTLATIRIQGKRLPLRRKRLIFRLRCPAAEGSGPCRGRVAVRTRRKVRLGGKRRRVKLAAARYEVRAGQVKRIRAPITGNKRTASRKVRLLRRSPKARRVETTARVRDSLGNQGRATKRQRVRVG